MPPWTQAAPEESGAATSPPTLAAPQESIGSVLPRVPAPLVKDRSTATSPRAPAGPQDSCCGEPPQAPAAPAEDCAAASRLTSAASSRSSVDAALQLQKPAVAEESSATASWPASTGSLGSSTAVQEFVRLEENNSAVQAAKCLIEGLDACCALPLTRAQEETHSGARMPTNPSIDSRAAVSAALPELGGKIHACQSEDSTASEDTGPGPNLVGDLFY